MSDLRALVKTKYPAVPSGELDKFMHLVEKLKLDPISNQIHLVARYDKKKGRDVYTVQVGIDGYRVVAERTGVYAGNDDPVFNNGASQFAMVEKKLKPLTASVTVYKVVGGVRCPFTATAEWSAYCPGGADFMWTKMPYLMLGKCAEALALRKAFPEALSGVYTDEEMAQAADVADLGPSKPQNAPLPPSVGKDSHPDPEGPKTAPSANQASEPEFAPEVPDAPMDATLDGLKRGLAVTTTQSAAKAVWLVWKQMADPATRSKGLAVFGDHKRTLLEE